jgi:tRNA G10  N-methylase Trm11
MGRCLDFLGRREDVVLYDPLCGAGSLLTVAALTHGRAVARVRATDIDPGSVLIAQKNLALFAPGGLAARAGELAEMGERFDRPSYAGAAESARSLIRLLPEKGIAAEAFVADAFRLPDDGFLADVILTDFPYGSMKMWASGCAEEFLAAMRERLRPGGVISVVMDKSQKCAAEGYNRLARQRIGKRKFEIYRRDE